MALLLSMLFLTGCATYEFDILAPQTDTRHIARKVDTTLDKDGLEYRLRAVENRLVMQIYNDTDQPVKFVGDSSFTVDPNGQSRPMRTQSIAPGSFIKLILPPMRPVVEPTGPTIGIGVGVGVSASDYRRGRYGHGYGPYDPFYDEPSYYQVYDDSSYYWDWNGESQIRLTLTYLIGDKTVTHNFTIARKKV